MVDSSFEETAELAIPTPSATELVSDLLDSDQLAVRAGARIVTTIDEAIQWLNCEPSIAIDLETFGLGERDGLSPWKGWIAVIAMYGPISNTCAVLHSPSGYYDPKLFRWLESRTIDNQMREYLTHNGANFDIFFLKNAGMDTTKVKWFDTLISEQASLSSGRKFVSVALGKVSERRLGKSVKTKVNHKDWGDPFLTAAQMEYVTGDIKYLHDIREEQRKKCAGDSRARATKVEMRLLPVTVKMTMHGTPIDMVQLDRYLVKQRLDAHDAKLQICAVFGDDINLNSPVQIKKAFNRIGYDVPNTKKETIVDISQEFDGTPLGDLCKAMTTYRYANQRIKMFSETWQQENISYSSEFACRMVHPRFRQLGTDTGRLSCNTPNFQQVPKDMRWVFGNVPGYSLVSVDYSAIEVRVAAALANDEAMIAALGLADIHRFVASNVFQKPEKDITDDERKIAKAATFTLLFAGSAPTMRQYAKVNGGSKISLEEAREVVIMFFKLFPGLKAMRENAYAIAERGSPVALTLPTGVRRVLVGEQLTPQRYLNTMVQGTAAAFMKYALIECDKTPYGDGMLSDLLCATVHDEIVAMVPCGEEETAQELIRSTMIAAAYRTLGHTRVPIAAEGDFGPTWFGSKTPPDFSEYDSLRAPKPVLAVGA